MNIYRQRLLNVAKALRESPPTARFSMRLFGSGCGSPMCALGHYAARSDLQEVFSLVRSVLHVDGLWVDGSELYDFHVPKHFGITGTEACRLFSGTGCGHAQTAAQAIEYIEKFVAEKWPVEEMTLPAA